MSYISVRGEQSTSVEIAALTALTALAASGSGQFIRKTGATSFENATAAESLSIALGDLTDVALTGAAQGDILFHNGTEWVNLPAGTNGYFLKTRGPGQNPFWDDVSSSGATIALDNLSGVSINASLLFDTDASYDIGSSSVGINDLHLGSGGVINFDGGDVTITHSANALTFAGGTIALGSAVTINGLTVTMADAGANAIFGWDDAAGAYENLSQAEVLAIIGDAAADASTKGVATFNASDFSDSSGTISIDYANGQKASTTQAGFITELATTTETNTGTDTTRAVTPDGLSSAVKSIMLTAAGGAPLTTAGCADPTKVEAATNDINYYVLDFDASTEEHAFWSFCMPENWDGGTVNATFYWTNAGGMATETVVWGIAGGSWGDDDAIDAALGTEITVTDTFLAQGDLHISSESSAITIANAAAGEWVNIVVARKVGSDDLTGDARLIAVKLTYTIDQYSDEI